MAAASVSDASVADAAVAAAVAAAASEASGDTAASSVSSAVASGSSEASSGTPSTRLLTSGLSSTTSTLFLSSTMAVPDADEVILGKAAVLYCQLAADAASGRRCPLKRINDMLLFSEDLYLPRRREQGKAQAEVAEQAKAVSNQLMSATGALRTATDAGDADGIAKARAALDEAKAAGAKVEARWDEVSRGEVPDIESLYSFSAKVHEMGQFSPETVVLSLILINRVSSTSSMPVGPTTWRLVGLIATLLAQKLWDDASVANSDFPSLLRAVLPDSEIDVRQINRLERRFLGLVNYKVTFTGSLYARYYFELRTIAEENHRKFRLAPLSKDQGERLEARSRSKATSLRDSGGVTMRRAKTSDDGMAPRSRAVLS